MTSSCGVGFLHPGRHCNDGKTIERLELVPDSTSQGVRGQPGGGGGGWMRPRPGSIFPLLKGVLKGVLVQTYVLWAP